MTNSAISMYNLGHDQAAELIGAVGHDQTVLLQGDMGSGKTSVLHMLAEQFPTHTPIYFDATTKDLGDLLLPKMKDLDGKDYVRFATNEELGLHLQDNPTIIMLDELGKAMQPVKVGLTRFMLERQMGSYKCHPDTIVFATTNLTGEGVGDMLQAHQYNRLTVVTMRKPSNLEWIEWAVNQDIDHTLLGWCKDNPQLFHSFTDVKDPEENPYIFHPKSKRRSFVTPRSLHKASDILKKRDQMDNHTLTAALMGTIGERGAMDLMAFVSLADKLPSLESIQKSPQTATVPDSPAAMCMVVYRTLSTLDKTWLDNWMTYLDRCDKEAQGLFANGVRSPKYSKQSLVMTNKKFTKWAMDHNYMFTADKT